MPRDAGMPGYFKTQTACIREMKRVYRLAHAGEIRPEDMTRFVNAVNMIRLAMNDTELETRIAKIEEMILAQTRK